MGREVGMPVIDVLVTTDGRRGAEVFGERLATGLGRRGWESDLVCLWGGIDPGRVGAEVLVRGSRRGRWDHRAFVALLRRLRRRRPDMVFANGGATLRYAALARLLSPWRFRLVYYSIGEPSYWAPAGAARTVQRLLMGVADVILAVSEPTRRQLVEDHGVASGKVIVVPTGVPDRYFATEPAVRRAEFVVLYVGSLSKEKDPLAAVAAVAGCGSGRPVVLRMVGSGPLHDAIVGAADARGVEVEMIGTVEDTSQEFGAADVFLQTSESEGLPGVVLEAGAAGIPVVAFDVGGVRDAMDDGASGYLIPGRSVSAAAEALRTLAEDEGLRLRMGARGRDFVRERFSLEPVLDRFDEVLRAGMSRREKARSGA